MWTLMSFSKSRFIIMSAILFLIYWLTKEKIFNHQASGEIERDVDVSECYLNEGSLYSVSHLKVLAIVLLETKISVESTCFHVYSPSFRPSINFLWIVCSEYFTFSYISLTLIVSFWPWMCNLQKLVQDLILETVSSVSSGEVLWKLENMFSRAMQKAYSHLFYLPPLLDIADHLVFGTLDTVCSGLTLLLQALE